MGIQSKHVSKALVWEVGGYAKMFNKTGSHVALCMSIDSSRKELNQVYAKALQ